MKKINWQRGIRRGAALMLAVVLLVGAAACSRKTEETSAETTTEETTEETTAETTTAETITEETTTVAETSAPAATDVAPLAGTPLTDKEDYRRRPVAVMIDNHPNARPQSGINQADLIYEMKVEGTYTRLMAVFQ